MYKILSQETKKQEVSRNKMCGDTKKNETKYVHLINKDYWRVLKQWAVLFFNSVFVYIWS